MLGQKTCLDVVSFLCLGSVWASTPATQPAADTDQLRVYEVNKTVAEFPEKEDFSTPESAYAVINRVMADGDESAWPRISVRRLAKVMPKNTRKSTVADDVAKQYLNARILEVRVFKGKTAGIIARIQRRSGGELFDLRSVELEDGRWLNTGQSVLETIEQARSKFASICGMALAEPSPPKVDDPEAFLKPFVEFLKANAGEPKPFILKALADHKVVIMGEVHHRPRYWDFNASLVTAPEFAATVGTIYMELPSHGQGLVDRFLTGNELDAMPVIDMLRDMMEWGWPDYPMLDFFTAVWKRNRDLPADQRLRIVLVDMPRPWKEIRKREDWRKYDTDRDRLMADNILADLRTRADDGRHALFIVGVGHTMLNLEHPSYPYQKTPMKSAGWYLREQLGDRNVYAVFPHMPVQTNVGEVRGRLRFGLFDSAFAALDNRPMAFPLTTGPFGEQPFDAMPDKPARGAYRDGYSGYLYLGTLEDEVFSPLIPGFYTDEFVKELDRRHRLMYGTGLVEAYRLRRLDGASVTDWVRRDWGRPRRNWQRGMGPIDAWKHAKNKADK